MAKAPDLAREFESRFAALERGDATLDKVLDWAGGLDRARGAKPVGGFLLPGGASAGTPEGFRAPDAGDCRVLEIAIRRGDFAIEDAIALVLLRHRRGRAETPLLDWLVRFEALPASEAEEIRRELDPG